MKKRVLALILAMSMVAALLSGCSSGSESSDSSQTESTSESSETESSAAESSETSSTDSSETASSESSAPSADNGEIVELNFYMMNSPVTDSDRIMEKANETIESKIGAHLNLIMVDSASYAEKMNLMINSGDDWDLCFTASWGGINFYQNAQKGAYADLTDLIKDTETYSRIPEGLWLSVTVNGKIYASVNYQMWGAASRSGFRFRSDIADEVGFDWQSIKGNTDTIEALTKIGDELLGPALELHPDMIGWETSATTNLFSSYPLYWDMEEVGDMATPGWIRYTEPDTVINQYETDEFMQFCTVMRDWYNKGYVRKDGATIQDTSSDRKAAKFIAEYTTGWPDTVDSNGNNTNLASMSMCTADIAPAVAVSTTRTVIKATAGSTAAIAVNALSDNIEKSVELIDLLNTDDELYLLITEGEEGVDYVYNDDGTYSLVDGKYNFNYNEWQIGQSYSPNFTRSLFEKNESGQKMEENLSVIYEADTTADVSPLTGFVFDSTNVKTQIANCTSIIDELVPALAAGSVDPEEKVPELISRLKDAGVDDIIAEKQSQLDAWKASD